MKDVATFCRWKFLLEALLRLPIGTLLLAVAGATPFMMQEDISSGRSSPAVLLLGVFPFLLGYAIFTSGVRRVQAACQRGCWLRAGPAGLSMRLPYKAEWRTAFLTNRLAEHSLTWAEVRNYYTRQYKLNGLPFGQALILETSRGRFNFGGYFRESAGIIIASIAAARTGNG